ncbi:MAG: nitrilase-related carbon-nitrogen hydrolase [Nitrososphaerales archaeon]
MPKSQGGSLTIALIQMSMSEDPKKNLNKALTMIKEASSMGAQIVCLSELFVSQYFPQSETSKEKALGFPNATTKALAKAAQENKIVLVAGSLYEKSGKKRYNTSLVFDEKGRTLGKYRKVHIPKDPSFYEQNYFDSGDEFRIFRTKYCNIGVLVCFDQWYPEAARIEKLLGAEVIFYPTAIGSVEGIDEVEGNWHDAWEAVQVGHAVSNSVIVAAANRVGKERDMTFWGGSFVCNQFGRILARGDDKEGIVLATCDLDLGKNVEQGWGFLKNRKPSTYKRITK